MSALLIDSGVESVTDLAALLPAVVRGRIGSELLAKPPSAAALRVLATIHDPHWHGYVGASCIDWGGLLTWARLLDRADPIAESVAVRVEVAASLAGYTAARPDLLCAARELGKGDLRAVLDALRIARDGVAGASTCTVDSRHIQLANRDYVLITVHGALDSAAAPQVRAVVTEARAAEQRYIAMDLTDAGVHGRRGLSPLVNAFFACKSMGGALFLVQPPKMVRRVVGQINGEPLLEFATLAELDCALSAGAR